jgi:predicted HicB family RNase H-like nuclease
MAKMGRPLLPKKQRRSVKITFRVTSALQKALEQRAKQEKKIVGRFIRDLLEREIAR